MSDIAITIDSISKAYRIGLKEDIPDTLFGSLVSLIKAPYANLKRLKRLNTFNFSSEDPDLIWAVKDISLEIRRGEVLGIVGSNGAGKSTLLKILSRITEPTRGCAVIHGRVSSLLEVGTGFHPELTGRENVYMNGTILGMKKKEIDRKFDEIVDFSGVEQFVDTPIKRYSSGMKVRLAFSVAAHLEPEILIVDEVLAVGDAAFQRKCIGKMQNVAGHGRTVLFVSHNMPAVTALCTRCALLEHGQVRLDDTPENVIKQYLHGMQTNTEIPLGERTDRTGTGEIRFTGVRIVNDCEAGTNLDPISGRPAKVVLAYESATKNKLRNVAVGLTFKDQNGTPIFTCNTTISGCPFDSLPGEGEIHCLIPELPIVGGEYNLRIWSAVSGCAADVIEQAATFTVQDGDFYGSGKTPQANKHGSFLVKHEWACQGLDSVINLEVRKPDNTMVH